MLNICYLIWLELFLNHISSVLYQDTVSLLPAANSLVFTQLFVQVNYNSLVPDTVYSNCTLGIIQFNFIYEIAL